jgi:arylsulfatase A-like enzyme
VDIMPTVLDVAGLPLPGDLQGQSLRTPRQPDSVVFTEARPTGTWFKVPRLSGTRRAIFQGSSKLILWSGGPSEMYDLAADPAETHNQFQQNEAAAASLASRLQGWTASAPQRSVPDLKPPDPAVLKRLRSLGYAR